MADSKRVQALNAKSEAFEKQTGKSSFSPVLTTKRTSIEVWLGQGKSEDQLLQQLSGVTREELRRFMAVNGLSFKKTKSAASALGGWIKGDKK